jgi:alkylated DNA repair protein alkB family protein 1
VIDVDDAQQLLDRADEVERCSEHALACGQLFSFPRHPGFFLLRGAVAPPQQRALTYACLTSLLEPPARTNHTAAHGALPGLWDAAQRGLVLAQGPAAAGGGVWAAAGGGVPAARLLRKLRWASAGPPFDWTRRQYDAHAAHAPLPPDLASLAARLAAAAAAGSAAGASPAPFRPDAALLNFYREGDTLCGHLDDAEADQAQPLVGLSLGCPGVLLVGGPTREVAPTAVLLRGGDAVVLSGQARRCFHGVPRVLPEPAGPRAGAAPEGGGESGGEDAVVAYMRRCRINVSVRATGLHSS